MAKKQTIFIFAIFLLPLLVAGVLYYIGYTGTLQNKGQWVNPPLVIQDIAPGVSAPNNFSWSVVIPCQQNCPELKLITAGISTLGAKSDLASIIQLTDNQLNPFGLEKVDFQKVYLADPSHTIILSYDKSHLQDIVIDLKKLLKPIERRI